MSGFGSKRTKTRKLLAASGMLLMGAALLAVLSPGTVRAGSRDATARPDIIDTAVSAGDFETLVAAVKAAGLVEALRGEGPFTVFAPTDEAFAKLPEGTLDALLADKEKLTAILTYHVVPGKWMAADVARRSEAKTLQGSSVTIDGSSGVKVDEASVIAADIEAANGVIHVIDAVITP